MSYRSDITLQCGETVFEKVREAYLKYGFRPQKLYDCGHGTRILQWLCVEWIPEDEHIAAILNALRMFDNADEAEENGYKLIELGENNYHNEISNRSGSMYFLDLYVTMAVDLPLHIKEI